MAVFSSTTEKQNAARRRALYSFGGVDKPLLVLISCLGLILASLAGLDSGLTGLALVGLGLLNTAHKADDAARREQRLATIKMAQSDRFRGVTRHLLKSFLSPAAMADEALVGRVIAMADAVGRENFVLQQHAILGRQDQSDTLRSLDVPVLVLGGSLDTLTPPERSEEIAALAPASQLLILEGVGHLSTLEAPQAVTEALNGFIAHIRHASG